jgi:Mg2+-importing ATPase
MDILCSDKTGTLTIGEVKLQSAMDVKGNPNNNKVLLYAYLNAVYETGFTNPIDKAIKDFCSHQFDISDSYSKLDEIPYDFIRKSISILISYSDKITTATKTKIPKSFIIVTKGALHNRSLV